MIGGAGNDSRIDCSAQYGFAHRVTGVKRLPHNAKTRVKTLYFVNDVRKKGLDKRGFAIALDNERCLWPISD